MKILLKVSDDFQISHLYEHIFINQFTNFLRDSGFLSFVDYDIYGESYPNGCVLLYIECYTNAASEFVGRHIYNFSTDLSNDEIYGSILQIMSEKKMTTDSLTEGYIDKLRALSLRKWVNYSHKLFEKEGEKSFDDYLNLVKASDNKFRKTSVVLSSSGYRRNRIFEFISKATVNNISEDIERCLFCYTDAVEEYQKGEIDFSEIVFSKTDLQPEDFDLERCIVDEVILMLSKRCDEISDILKLANSKKVEDCIKNIKIEIKSH